jgi:glycosyltransferase involved in cell wall biosynthesis
MVRNEEDVIEPVLRHLVAEGVDGVLIADNVSDDGTRSILERLARDLPMFVVDEPETGYYQSETMTALARAAGELGADWIIPFDADELWLVRGTTLRAYFEGMPADVGAVFGQWLHHRPRFGTRDERTPFESMVLRQKSPDPQRKIAFRARGDVRLWMGNHNVDAEHPLRRVDDPRLEVHHYPFRSFEQMVRKTRNGKAALDRAGHHPWVARHWQVLGSQSDLRLRFSWLKLVADRRGVVEDPVAPSRSAEPSVEA